jgi:hypothetical protein
MLQSLFLVGPAERLNLIEALSLYCSVRAVEAHTDGMLHRKRSAIESLFQGLSVEDSRR